MVPTWQMENHRLSLPKYWLILVTYCHSKCQKHDVCKNEAKAVACFPCSKMAAVAILDSFKVAVLTHKTVHRTTEQGACMWNDLSSISFAVEQDKNTLINVLSIPNERKLFEHLKGPCFNAIIFEYLNMVYLLSNVVCLCLNRDVL